MSKRLNPDAIRAILKTAIRERHAVTIAFSTGQPQLVEPYNINNEDIFTYMQEDGQFKQHRVDLLSEVVDLGKTWEQIRSDQDTGS